MQVPGRIGLGIQNLVHALDRQGIDHTVVEYSGRMHHGTQLMLPRNRGEQSLQPIALGDIDASILTWAPKNSAPPPARTHSRRWVPCD